MFEGLSSRLKKPEQIPKFLLLSVFVLKSRIGGLKLI